VVGTTVCRHRVPRDEVLLVRRLSAKRRTRKHPVVFIDVERHQSTNSGDAVQRVEEEPLMFNVNRRRASPRICANDTHGIQISGPNLLIGDQMDFLAGTLLDTGYASSRVHQTKL
jgi:hypothetical protein